MPPERSEACRPKRRRHLSYLTASAAHSYEDAGSAGILPVFFTALSCFVVAIGAMGVGMNCLEPLVGTLDRQEDARVPLIVESVQDHDQFIEYGGDEKM